MWKACSTCGLVHQEGAPCASSLDPRRLAAATLLGLSLGTAGCPVAVALYGVEVVDLDEDGYFDGEDCDDSDPDIHPGAEETPDDGVDSDCDGEDNPVDDTDPADTDAT
jgi:hypothetical protein